tara:strand:- start:349 stop:618 length:270 start_codon:yes stop_codon:yes gene_type:complete
MKITKRQLKRIIREEKLKLMEGCGDPVVAQPEVGMPCPFSTATELKSAGASEGDVLDWIQKLLGAFQEGSQDELMMDDASGYDLATLEL